MPDSEISAKLIVTDTGPLITLAAADVLDYLLYPGVVVYVPDAVLYEATINSNAIGTAGLARSSRACRPACRPSTLVACTLLNPTHNFVMTMSGTDAIVCQEINRGLANADTPETHDPERKARLAAHF